MTHRQHKGQPKTADISTLAVLEAVETIISYVAAEKKPYEILMAQFNCVEKVADGAVMREVNKGLLDYGVSLAYPWLTPAGAHWLEFKRMEDAGS